MVLSKLINLTCATPIFSCIPREREKERRKGEKLGVTGPPERFQSVCSHFHTSLREKERDTHGRKRKERRGGERKRDVAEGERTRGGIT